MKKDIHPKYHKDAVVVCACGNTYNIGSTIPTIHVEVCSKCHPFWTGEEKMVDMEGRVDKFKRKREAGDKARLDRIKKIKDKIEKEKARQEAPKSLKDMLKAMQ